MKEGKSLSLPLIFNITDNGQVKTEFNAIQVSLMQRTTTKKDIFLIFIVWFPSLDVVVSRSTFLLRKVKLTKLDWRLIRV